MYIKQWLENLSQLNESSIIFCLTLINLGDSRITVHTGVLHSVTWTIVRVTLLSAIGRAKPVKSQTLNVSVSFAVTTPGPAVAMIQQYKEERHKTFLFSTFS